MGNIVPHSTPLTGKWFRSEHDLLALDIIDWSRAHHNWESVGAAISDLAGWLIGTAKCFRVTCDLRQAPERDDWPNWEHTAWGAVKGDHETMGKLYWNWFQWRQRGRLTFRDSPDFAGTFQKVPSLSHTVHFWGDFGQVSPIAFGRTLKLMQSHDLWISVVDASTQILIEPMVSYSTLWDNWCTRELFSVPEKEEELKKPLQLSLFHGN